MIGFASSIGIANPSPSAYSEDTLIELNNKKDEDNNNDWFLDFFDGMDFGNDNNSSFNDGFDFDFFDD